MECSAGAFGEVHMGTLKKKNGSEVDVAIKKLKEAKNLKKHIKEFFKVILSLSLSLGGTGQLSGGPNHAQV